MTSSLMRHFHVQYFSDAFAKQFFPLRLRFSLQAQLIFRQPLRFGDRDDGLRCKFFGGVGLGNKIFEIVQAVDTVDKDLLAFFFVQIFVINQCFQGIKKVMEQGKSFRMGPALSSSMYALRVVQPLNDNLDVAVVRQTGFSAYSAGRPGS